MSELDLTKVTRVTIVGRQSGVLDEHWADTWEAYLLDGGRTLKLFACGTGASARAERDTALAEDIADITAKLSRATEFEAAPPEEPRLASRYITAYEALAANYRRCGGSE